MQSEDTWSLQMEFESGAVGQLTVAMACPQTAAREDGPPAITVTSASI